MPIRPPLSWNEQEEIARKMFGEPDGNTILGVGPDAPTVTNERGGKQSATPYRFTLLDAPTMLRLLGILTTGAAKYGADNWRNISTAEHLDHAGAHILAHLAGDRQDDHLGHALCRLMMACAMEGE